MKQKYSSHQWLYGAIAVWSSGGRFMVHYGLTKWPSRCEWIVPGTWIE